MDDVDEKKRADRRFSKHGDYSIQGLAQKLAKDYKLGVEILDRKQGPRPRVVHVAVLRLSSWRDRGCGDRRRNP